MLVISIRTLSVFFVALFISLLALCFMPVRTTEAFALTTDQLVYSDFEGVYVSDSSLSTSTTLLDRTTAGLDQIFPGVVLSPDRRFVYFQVKVPSPSSLVSVYRMDADGTNIQDMGYDIPQYSLYDSALSPDGKRIAYWSTGGKIAIRNIDGTGTISQIQARSTATPQVTYAKWLGDNKLTFGVNLTPSAGTCGVVIASINTDGTGFTPLTPDNSSLPANSCDTLKPFMATTSDGTKILYTKGSVTTSYLEKLYVLNVNDSTETEVFTVPSAPFGGKTEYGDIFYAAWARDQQRIVIDYAYPPIPNSQAGRHLGILELDTLTISADRHIDSEMTGNIGVTWQ